MIRYARMVGFLVLQAAGLSFAVVGWSGFPFVLRAVSVVALVLQALVTAVVVADTVRGS